jgi:hypothetical protein
MDFTTFIQRKEDLEVALKSGLYIVQQSHLPLEHQAFRCGLAGKPADSATRAFQSKQSNFASRFANYLNYWLPTNAKVYACLTVPRVVRAGFSERILTEREEGDSREDYAREYQTLIQVREAQFHNLLKSYGMQRLGMPGVAEEKKRSEFFRGPLATAKRALKAIGVGEYYEFPSNGVTDVRKITLTRGETIETQAVRLRESPRLVANRTTVERLSRNEPSTVRAFEKVTEARRSPRLDTTPVMVTMREKDLERLRTGDPQMVTAMTRLKDITPVRRSSRLRVQTRRNYRE